MKHLKTYENLLDDYLDKDKELQKVKKQFSSIFSQLKKQLAQYLYLNKNRWNEWGVNEYEDYEIQIDDFEFLQNGTLSIDYRNYYDEVDNIVLSKDDLKDLGVFLDNPDLYANAKKYNL